MTYNEIFVKESKFKVYNRQKICRIRKVLSNIKEKVTRLTVITWIAVPPLRLPGRRSNLSGGFRVNGVDAGAPRDPPVRIRRGVLTGGSDTSELLVKGVQFGRNVLTDEGVENDLEQRPVPEHPEQLHSRPTYVSARLLGSYCHLEDVGVVFVHGLPFG